MRAGGRVRYRAIDRLLMGALLWRAQRNIAYRRLERSADDSPEQEDALKQFVKYDFAVEYGRPAPSPIMRCVSSATKAGVDPEALGVLVANQDIQLTPTGISLRRLSVAIALAWAVRLVSIAAVLEFALLTFTAPAPWWIRLAVFAGAMAALLPFLYVLHLFSTRSLRAMRQVESDFRVLVEPEDVSERASNVIHFDRTPRR